jgi:putative membrane protein
MPLPSWHPHPDVWLLIAGLAAAYGLALRDRRRRVGADGQPPASRRQVRLFAAGVVVMWVGADWPMHDLAEGYLYSAHMVQHMLFGFVASPLLIAGTPAWMWRSLLRPGPAMAVWRFVTRPLVALALFNGVILLIHWPAVVELQVTSELAHLGLHALILGSGIVMWWPVLSPLPELPALARPLQVAYLFGQSILPTIPASFLTFGQSPLYPVYAAFPRIWGIDVMTDQLIAGLIMKLAGGAILWTVMAAVFFRWFEQERNEGWDALRWRDVDRDVRAGMARR